MEIGLLFGIFAFFFLGWRSVALVEDIDVDVWGHIKAALICCGVTIIIWLLYHYGSVRV